MIPERHGYGVRFSLFNPNLLIVGTSQTYGKKGEGTLFLLKLLDGDVIRLKSFDWTDGLFDVVSFVKSQPLREKLTNFI